MKNIKLIILAGIVVLAFLFRFLIAGTDVVYPDSCRYLSYAKSIATGKFTFNFLEAREVILPPMFPLFTALFSFFVNGVELSGIIVSSIAGALLIVPIFYISKTVFNEKAAWISVVFVFISPVLIHWSGAMLTESIFITAFISAIAIGLYSFGNGRRAYLGLCGAMVGLAYMSRVVGFILIPIIGLWIIYHVMSTGKLGDYGKIVKNIIISGVIFILGFIIITAPYLVHIRSHYGNWSLAGGYGSISGMVANEGASNVKDWEALGSKKPVEESFHMHIDPQYKIITFVGRLIEAKGVQDLIKVFEDIRHSYKVKLLVVGPGSYLQGLRKIAGDNPDIIFTGEKSEEEIIELLSITDIFVNPSYSEGLPTSVLEAASCGCPIIASDVGGTKEIIQHGRNGLLFSAKDTGQLSSMIRSLLDNSQARLQYGVHAREAVESKFDWDMIASQYTVFLNKQV